MIKFLISVLLLSLVSFETAYSQACTNTYGNKLNGLCQSVDQCTGAAFIGNCTNANFICCMEDKTIQIAENKKLTKRMFLKLVGNTTRNNAMYNYVVESMNLATISGRSEDFKIAAYLSHLVGETSYFRKIESGIIDKNDVESEMYQGRGGILIRGKSNYELANNSTRYSKI
jgi:hypothetical protein